MYLDGVVIAGVGTVLLMVGFMVAFGLFVVRDAKAKGSGRDSRRNH